MAQKFDKDDAHHDDNLHFCCNNYMLVLKIAAQRERSIAHHRLSLLFIALLDCTAMRRPSIFIMNTWFNKTFGDEGSIITFIFKISILVQRVDGVKSTYLVKGSKIRIISLIERVNNASFDPLNKYADPTP